MPKHVPGVRPPPVDGRPKNKLLASLPDEDFERLKPHLKTISTKVRQVLHRRNEPVREVFFPNGGVASITTARLNRWVSRRKWPAFVDLSRSEIRASCTMGCCTRWTGTPELYTTGTR